MNNKQIGNSRTNRIEYIDALRGFTMLLVVTRHVFYFGHLGLDNSINETFSIFRMPLFFFISGFILYKENFVWNISNTLLFLWKKCKVQIFTTLIALTSFCITFHKPLFDLICHNTKGGYWFTITLFFCFCIFAIVRLLLDRYNKNAAMGGVILIGLFLWKYTQPLMGPERETFLIHLFSIERLRYFIFFGTGTLCKMYFKQFEKTIENKYFMAICIALFLAFAYIKINQIDIPKQYIFQMFAGIFGAIITFAFFKKHNNVFSKDKRIGRISQYIGRRTLDIYFLHYFFLPNNLCPLNELLPGTNSQLLSFVYALLVASIVMCACLLTSNILRLSPFIAHYLFGVKVSK